MVLERVSHERGGDHDDSTHFKGFEAGRVSFCHVKGFVLYYKKRPGRYELVRILYFVSFSQGHRL